MEIINLIIAAVVALIVGCFVTWLIMRGKGSHEEQENTTEEPKDIPDPRIEELTQQLKITKESKEQAISKRKELEEQITQLENQLQQKETKLKDLASTIDELSTLPSDIKEAKLIESLKKDIKERTDVINQKEKEIISIKKDLKKKAEEVDEKEEEIEELEDEISSIKKKLKTSKAEVEELTSKIDASEKKAKNLERELQDMESVMTDLKKENEVKDEAIEFVNAVLQAKDADDRDATIINKKVAKIESIIYDEYIPLQRQYFKDAIEDFDGWISYQEYIAHHWANLQRKSWLKRKKVIAFIGEFSAGKTSIVNRILSQDDPNCPRLPVSSKATTAIATYISYGEGFNSQFTDANGDLKNLPSEMFMKVNKDILSKVNVSSVIQYFVMKYKNENLQGLSILDTPGFSSNDEQDKDRTLNVIKEADAIFWVVDANSGEVNRTSLKIIAENIENIPLYIIINKADTKSPTELSKLEKHIRETMNRAEINVTGYLTFSQKAPLKDMMSVIEALPDARTGLDIANICLDLKRDINNLQENLDDIKKDLREYNDLIDNREEIISADIEEVVESSYRIESIPQYNSRFFGKDDYRMAVDEYNELTGLCGFVKETSDQIKECFNDYTEFLKEYHKISEIQSNKKEQYDSTKKIYDNLMKAIKDLDQNLYREIESAVKEFLRNEEREHSQTQSSRRSNQHNASSNYSSSNSSNYSTSSSQFDLEKADYFYHQGKTEEAKFWYKKAAKQGNKSAQQMCQKLGISY